MSEPNPDVVLARAATLVQSMDNLRDEFREVQERERTNRRVIVALGVVAVLSLVAIVVAIVFAVRANDASSQAKDAVSTANINRTAQIATCVSTNDSRRVAKRLWDFVLSAAAHGAPPPTAEQRKQLVQFQRMVNAAYAPRDCSPSGVAHSSPPPPTK